jgi:formylglycine-generating enzyme required for sulfatase activity
MVMKRTVLLLAAILLSLRGFSQGDIHNIQMVFVKGGNFYMGCDDKQYVAAEFADERPVHRVSISSYYIGKYEVTLKQWREVMGINPPTYNGVEYGNKKCDDCPVVKISYEDIQNFITKLNEKNPGKHYRLPTETEWEYAANGGKYTANHKYSGSDKASDIGWYGKENSTTHPAGQKKPNELSIYDMTGNVAEWCTDWYDSSYYDKTINALNPKGPEKGDKKVLRGGSYSDDDVICRNAYRSRSVPTARKWNIGFRLALDY